MLNYINSFSLSTSEDKSKVVVHLRQNYPVPSSEENDTIRNEIIDSIILDADTATSLCVTILDSLDKLEKTEDIEK